MEAWKRRKARGYTVSQQTRQKMSDSQTHTRCLPNCECGRHKHHAEPWNKGTKGLSGTYPRNPRIKFCGVYAILNTVSGEMYIGSSTDLVSRMHFHYNRIKRGYHGYRKIQIALDRDGPEAFTVVILEICESKEQYEKETEWLQANRPEYNNLEEASRKNKGISVSEETKRILVEKGKGNTNRKYGKKRVA